VLAVTLLLVIASAPYAKHYVETRRCGKQLAAVSQAARIWANAHDDCLPGGFILMSNELVTPRLLVCPGEKSREPADNWQALTSANSSYQIGELASRAKDFPPEIRQQIRYLECKVHGGNYANALGKVSVDSRPVPLTILSLAGLAIVALLGRRLWHRYRPVRQFPGGKAAGELLPRIEQVRRGYLAACGTPPSPWYRKGLLAAARHTVRALAFFAHRKSGLQDREHARRT
jgi:hypothetical protein